MTNGFSWARMVAVLRKECLQMLRDRMTLSMLIGIPIVQLLVFGYAINLNPKHLPTAVHLADSGAYSRAIVAALENSGYFDIVRIAGSAQEATHLLDTGEVTFSITIPANFTRDLIRGTHPQILAEVDATDPATASYALSALSQLADNALKDDLHGPLARNTTEPPFETVIQRRYNPESITQYNIVPGIMAVILTMTMVMITAMAMTRESERGTLENLLAMPTRPIEVMIGKVLPFVLVGYVQVVIVLLVSRFLFDVPMIGPIPLLLAAVSVFLMANLAVGFTFSTLAQNQLQAMQMTVFYLLPSILLSGFAFPFYGMPVWAQYLGSILPTTHFLRIVRGILLKGNGFTEIWPSIWPMLIFIVCVGTLALLRYRRTLD
jgi:ABC-2 type transport system permease protein